MRKILSTGSAPTGHWVGDGFPVRSLFSHMNGSNTNTPFLMLDYGGPHDFAPTTTPRGVGVHPHKGFETVTIVYDGEVEHGDGAGRGGVIREGDVQWMTAGNGIFAQGVHSHDFTAKGGRFEMVQLWVNLPAAEGRKSTAPAIRALQMPKSRPLICPTVQAVCGSSPGRSKGPRHGQHLLAAGCLGSAAERGQDRHA